LALFYFLSFDCEKDREAELKKLIVEAVEWMKTQEDLINCYHGTYQVCSGGPREYEMVLMTNDWGVLDRLNEKANTYIHKFCELTKNRTMVIGERLKLGH